MALFTTPIETEQFWSRKAMGTLWATKDLDPKLKNSLDMLYKSRQKDSAVGKTKVKYYLGGKDSITGKLGFGRLYSKGFETYEAEARGYLCGDYYHDIDVVNCHPTLMWQFAEKAFEDKMPECRDFCANRQKYYAEVADNKEEAKAAIFKILYGGACDLPSLYPFKKECDTLAKKLTKHTDYNKLWEAIKEKEVNPLGSFLSYVLQTEERKVMLCMRQFFLEKGWSVDVLCYDGIQVRKKEGKEMPATLLEEAQGVILEKTGYSIKLGEKPFAKYTLPETADKLLDPDILVNDSYAAEHLSIIAGDSLLQDHGELYSLINGVWVRGEKGVRSLIHTYREQLVFRQMGSLAPKIYDYGGCERHIPSVIKQLTHFAKEGTFPIQLAYSLTPMEPSESAVPRFLELITLWTRGNQPLYDYTLNWFAHSIQKPRENPGVMLIVTGKKGCGKDTPTSFLAEYVYGSEYATSYNKTEQFFDFYDTGKRNKLFVRLEEANRAVCYKNQDTLKSYITSKTMEVNEKHKDKITVPNYCRYVFTTNKGNPVAFTDGERRFVIMPCSDEKVGDRAYWEDTYEILSNAGAGRAVGEYLAQRDILQFNPREYPVNSYQEEVIDSEKSSEEKFIDSWDGEKTSAGELYDKYREYCIAESLSYTQTSDGFFKKLLNFIRDNRLEKFRGKNGVQYGKPVGDG